MNDRTITRASRQGTRTAPIEGRKAKYIRGEIKLSPEELAIAMELARGDRIDRDLAAYAIRKRDES